MESDFIAILIAVLIGYLLGRLGKEQILTERKRD